MSVFSSLLAGQSSREIGRLLKGVIQKQVNQELTNTDIVDAENQTPVKISNSKDLSLVGDMAQQATFNIATELATNHYMTFEPDGVDLRLWLKFQNAGTLVDYAKQNIKAYTVGQNNLPGTFIHYNSDLNVKYEIFSYFNGSSHFAFARDDPAIQIKNIIVDNVKNFAMHMRMKPISLVQSLTTDNITIFSKIDDDQLRYGYAATITPEGHMHFYVRDNYIQYHLFIRDAYSWLLTDPTYAINNNFNRYNFNANNYQTSYRYLCSIANSPDLSFEDWIYNYKPSTHQQYVISNGSILMADSTTVTEKPYLYLSLQDGQWNQLSSTVTNTTMYDASGNAKNGTLSGIYTFTDDNEVYNPGANGTTGGMEISFASNPTINTLTQFTIGICYWPKVSTNAQSFGGKIVSKGVNVNNSFWIEHVAGTSKIKASIRNSSGSVTSVTSTTDLVQGEFNFILFRWKSGENLKLILNRDPEVLSSSTLSTTISNSSDVLKLGSISESVESKLAVFRFHTIRVSDETALNIQLEGYHNPLFPKAESIQPVPDPDPLPITVPFVTKFSNIAPTPITATDYRYANSTGGDNPYFQVYGCTDGVSVVDPITQRYSVGIGSIIPGTPISEMVSVPSSDNSANILQKTSTTNEIAGVKIIDDGNIVIPPPPDPDNPPPPPTPTGGATDQYGVKSTYGTGPWRGDFTPDYHSDSDSMRWDFDSVGANNFKSIELTAYLRAPDEIPADEVTGILGGGGHSSGSSPECYNVGIDTITGATRYRMEEDHPDNIDGEDGNVGTPLKATYQGYRFIKWNRSDGVHLEIWQDRGNNEGTTPANEWVKVSSWVESDFNWQQPPSDHQESLRIDDMASEDQLDVKWMSIREILATDGLNTLQPATRKLSFNSIIPEPTASIGQTLAGQVIKKAKFWMQGGSSPTGTGYCRIWDENNNPVVTMGSFSASSLDDNNYEGVTFTNDANTVPMKLGYTIGIEYNTGSSSDYIKLQRQGVNYDSSITQASKKYGGAWGINDAFEIKCELTYTYVTPDIDPYWTLGSTTADIGLIGEVFNEGSPMIGISPTHFECRMYRDLAVAGGIIKLAHISSTNAVKGILKTVAATTLPLIEPTDFNFVWENFNYNSPIAAGDRLVVSVEGVGTNAIYVMTNSGAPATENYDTTKSCLVYYDNVSGWATDTTLDISGKMASGGNSFDAFERFAPTKIDIGEKIVTRSSVLHNRRITRVVARGKKIGSPTGTITCGIMDFSFKTKAILGTFDASTASSGVYGDMTFSNPGNSYNTVEGDRIYLRYPGGTATNTIELCTGRDFVDEQNSIMFAIDDGVTTEIGNKDLAGRMYIGGDLDANSRSRIVQSIEVEDSILKGLKITKIVLQLYRTTVATTGTAYCNIRRGSDDQVVAAMGSVAVSTLSTNPASPTAVTFTNLANDYVLTVGDKVSFEFSGGNTTDHVGVLVRDVITGKYDFSYSYVKRYNDVAYVDAEPQVNLVGTMYEGGFTYTPEPNAPPAPTPVADKDLTICAGRNKNSGFFEAILTECRIYSKEITIPLATSLYENKYSISPLGPNEVLIPFTFRPSGLV